MYVKDGILLGGFTIKIIYDDLGPAEKRELEEQVGAKIRLAKLKLKL